MNDIIILLANRRIRIKSLYNQTIEFLKEYLDDSLKNSFLPTFSDFEVSITEQDIRCEREKSSAEDRYEGRPIRHWSEPYLETLAIYRKIAEKMPVYETVLFHGSAIAVDGEGYLFTATSGTGKSTHTKLWRQLLGEKVQMINDDKPLIRVDTDKAIVYGTPWDGKHHLSTNTSVPLKAICIIKRGITNRIQCIDPMEAYPMLIQQMYKPLNEEAFSKSLDLIDRLLRQVQFYEMYANMDISAAQLAYQAMKE